jgi:hypothetical protein
MVGPSNNTGEGERNRGQLVLVGAVGIGLVIIGLVIVINTSLVSENIAASESLQKSDEVTKFSTNARRDTRAIVLRINHRKRNITAPQIASYVNRNLSNYSRALAESHARSGIASVKISFNNESSDWGTRLVQVNDSDLTEPGTNDVSWALFDGTVREPDVRRFILNLNVTATAEKSTDEFNVTFTNSSGDYVEMGIKSTGKEIEIRTERTPGGNVTDVVCDPSNDRVLINLMTGQSYTGDCDFNGVLNRTNSSRSLDPPYDSVVVEFGDRPDLQYSVVTNLSYEAMGSSSPGYDHCDPAYVTSGTAGSPTAPCRSPAIWRANVTTVYQSWSSDYWQLHNVSVYP